MITEIWRICADCNTGGPTPPGEIKHKPPYCLECGKLVDMGEPKIEECNCSQALDLKEKLQKAVKLDAAKQEYIEYLGEYCGNYAAFMANRGMEISKEEFQKGEQLRQKIKENYEST